MATMRAVGVEKYGPIENLESREVPKPGSPKGRDLLIKVEACSVNPIDTKIRNGTYDDSPDYYKRAPKPFHIMGFDGAGTVLEVGPQCTFFKPGDEVFYVSLPIRQGTYAEFHLVDERDVAHKPKRLDFVEAAAMPLTYGTAYESLIERLEIKKGENVGILIINGAGGVGAMASQIARWVLDLPVVVTTASRPETIQFSKKMGATHVISHREDLKQQIVDLKLDVPIK
jgi:NADPH:quinone reductase-like Zn-dependent oxidoreductase